MTARPGDKLQTQFEEYGTLPKPLIIGRIVRLAMGLWLLDFLFQLSSHPGAFFRPAPPSHWTMGLVTMLGIMVTPYLINLGFSRNWRHWPRTAVVAAAALLIVIDFAFYGTWWAPPLGAFALAWFVYWTGHLGISFAVSAVIATPGCEMRALPHLWTLLSGVKTQEHHCPGFLDRLDRWERGFSQAKGKPPA